MPDEEDVLESNEAVETPTPRKRGRRRLKRARQATKARKSGISRGSRPFPAASFEESLAFAHEMFVVGSGQPVRRLTLFDHLKKAPESGTSRMLIVNSNRYGLTKGAM
jgi:hypothetical protein